MSKYQPLTDYLEALPGERASMTFTEIEGVLGFKLPRSSYEHRALWSNNAQGHVMTKAWLKAGWRTESVDMDGRKLVFRKAANSPDKTDYHTDRSVLNLRITDRFVLQRLRQKAALHGTTIEEEAHTALSRGSALTPDERRKAFAGIREASPDLGGVDLPAIIRENRDAR
jgi:plasmid stability protein